MSLKDLILNQNDLPTTTVTIPEWKDAEGKPLTLTLRSLMASEREVFERQMLAKTSDLKKNVRATYAAMSIIDENGNVVFSAEDIEQLGKKNAIALNRIFEAVQSFNALTEADVKELEKN